MKCRTKEVAGRLILSGIFCNSYTWELTVFAKCSAANLLLNPTPGRNYGQKADFCDLPVKISFGLRAKPTFNAI